MDSQWKPTRNKKILTQNHCLTVVIYKRIGKILEVKKRLS